ncbi:GtrA family protein [Streptomyces acidiscabies]|uniref:GtrA family protein n=1 Tax=Streptomyces acidiscabies TaxID=42234 RepID=UPI000950FEF2|nr:GtrA family protein [Streptomyces acidiscabies]
MERNPVPATGPVASFLRFVLCGGGIGVLSSLAVPLVAMSVPWVVANAVITVVSTVLCTEVHARFTFGTGRGAGVREHWQSAGAAGVAYVVTSGAVVGLHAVMVAPSLVTEQIVYLGASGFAGMGRFLVLRWFVFAGRGGRGGAVGVAGVVGSGRWGWAVGRGCVVGAVVIPSEGGLPDGGGLPAPS